MRILKSEPVEPEVSICSPEVETPNLKAQPVEELSQPIEQDGSALKFSCEACFLSAIWSYQTHSFQVNIRGSLLDYVRISFFAKLEITFWVR